MASVCVGRPGDRGARATLQASRTLRTAPLAVWRETPYFRARATTLPRFGAATIAAPLGHALL